VDGRQHGHGRQPDRVGVAEADGGGVGAGGVAPDAEDQAERPAVDGRGERGEGVVDPMEKLDAVDKRNPAGPSLR
jgi:hypothetical protein